MQSSLGIRLAPYTNSSVDNSSRGIGTSLSDIFLTFNFCTKKKILRLHNYQKGMLHKSLNFAIIQFQPKHLYQYLFIESSVLGRSRKLYVENIPFIKSTNVYKYGILMLNNAYH